jgi:(1->4)-alpha-D-glucan 1-alpha-D-glucosylmutase
MRARINVLSELPEEWEKAISRWRRLNPKRSGAKGKEVPDPNDEYFLYQTLSGSFPLAGDAEEYRKRLKAYMIKAVREAKVHTEWLKPDIAYEEAFVGFAEEFLKAEPPTGFLNDFLPFAQKIAFHGMLNSLSQTVLKIASPGVPDFYQGTELWDLRFVDPDNRGPVDFERRSGMLREFGRRGREDRAGLVRELLEHWSDGRFKLYTIYKGLNLRREEKKLFQSGDYAALYGSGNMRENVCALLRRSGQHAVIAAAPRFTTRLAHVGSAPLGERVWGESTVALPAGSASRWVNVFTGEEVDAGGAAPLRLGDIFRSFPVALLQAI